MGIEVFLVGLANDASLAMGASTCVGQYKLEKFDNALLQKTLIWK